MSTCWIAAADWIENFQIPWTKFPEGSIKGLERGKRPSPWLRIEMVWIVITEMMNVCASPSIKASTEVAKKKKVPKYPLSLQDVTAGDVVGRGCHSLVKQLQARIENVKRSSAPRVKKMQMGSDCDIDEIPAEQLASMQDTYGCIN